MKLAITALLAAALPAYAGCDYTMKCYDELYAGTPQYKRVRFAEHYSDVCLRTYQCQTYLAPGLQSRPDGTNRKYWIGYCKGCLESYGKIVLDGGECVLTQKCR
ncbi:hypothetical protein E4U55_004424 [Claviceps digitariae]|nr:hypothetical protein E4U55_004424 [Claviceps digitariae]